MAKKKHLGQNISPSGTAVPGGLINEVGRVLMTRANIVECRKGADVVFVIDSTFNTRHGDFRDFILGTVINIIDRLDVDSGRTRVAVVQFTLTAKVRFTCTHAEMLSSLDYVSAQTYSRLRPRPRLFTKVSRQ